MNGVAMTFKPAPGLTSESSTMILFLLAYLGGVLTIVSPCIIPVLPFVFARADRPFLRSGLPMLVRMAVTFAAVATLAAVTGGWATAANQYGARRRSFFLRCLDWLSSFLVSPIACGPSRQDGYHPRYSALLRPP
jgi:cytochrome c biogenesis protein CcdA